VPVIDCLTAASFAVLGAASMLGTSGRGRRWQSVGAALTALWALALAWPALQPAEFASEEQAGLLAAGFDVARFAVWYLSLLLLIDTRQPADPRGLSRRVAVMGTLATAVVIAFLDIAAGVGLPIGDEPLFQSAGLIGHLAFALTGLVIVENVWRNARGDRFWSIKFLLLAVGSICAFDFYLYSDALLFNQLDADLFRCVPGRIDDGAVGRSRHAAPTGHDHRPRALQRFRLPLGGSAG